MHSTRTADSSPCGPMAKYTLHYFNLRGRAELTRLIFAAAGVEYTDHRMTGAEWQELKSQAPTGQLPCMEIEIDGKTVWLGQSMAIARYIAREHRLAGNTSLEKARADSIVDSTVDLFAELLKQFLEKDEAKKNEIQKRLDSEVLPKYLSMFSKLLTGNQNGGDYFVGDQLTWADLAVFNILFSPLKSNPKLLDDYPKLKANRAKVSENAGVTKHVETRPETSFENMVNYKLTYFAARGRAELIRLIFHAGGVKFVDERIEGKDWPALKPKIPHGALPALEMDGQVFGQSIAIARYVARQVGLAGKTPIEEFRADELVDTVTDFGQAYIKVRFEKDEAKKAELKKDFQANTVPNFISKLSNLLKSSGDFFIGKIHPPLGASSRDHPQGPSPATHGPSVETIRVDCVSRCLFVFFQRPSVRTVSPDAYLPGPPETIRGNRPPETIRGDLSPVTIRGDRPLETIRGDHPLETINGSRPSETIHGDCPS
ncbi:uncharacterized protein LOC135471087 [Liolophura sinensis]|uniref:uncharacterized protein LOC135471087 n=1 Tax=Liolophura sinensis TaxID=3198878 RepID=UPI003158F8D5